MVLAVFGMLLGLVTAPQVRGQAGPIAHWKFDEPSGPTAFDSAGNNHGALSVAGAMFVPGGISGNAISLDKAANGLVNMGNVLMLGGSNFTVGGWIKTAAGAAPGFGTFVAKHEANTANGYFLSYDHTVIANGASNAFFYAGTRTILAGGFSIVDVPVSTTRVNDGNWHHVVGVYRLGGTTTVYVDGAPVEGSIASSPIAGNNAPFLIGGANQANVPTAFFTGLVDDVQIYDRALTDQEIDFLFRNPGSEVLPAANGSCTIPPNMIAWWKGDGNANDSVGSNHGLNVGGVTYAPGKRGMAFSFSGNGTDYIEVPANPSLDTPTNGALTVEMWALRLGTNPPLMHMLGKRIGCTGAGGLDTLNYEMALNMQTTREGLRFGGTYTPVSTGLDLPTNAWTHIVGTFNGSQFAYYVNGALVGSRVGELGIPNSAPLRIGVSGDCFVAPFSGLLDEIAMYNRALTPAEVQALFLAGGEKCLPKSNCIAAPPGLVSMWPFDGNLNDAVGVNHAAMVGSPVFIPGQVAQGLYFTNGVGLTNYARIPASASLDVGAGPGLTVEGWINPDTTNSPQPLVEWNDAPGTAIQVIGMHFWINTAPNGSIPGGLYANLQRSPTGLTDPWFATPPGVITTGRYQHVALTYDQISGLARIYVGGVRVAETNLGSFRPDTAYDLYLGMRPASNSPLDLGLRFTGAMDELSLYNRALTGTEVQAIAQAGAQGKYGPCVTNGIAAGPVDLVVLAGATANFGVELSGNPPLGYQWTKNGFNIAGATGASLYITNASLVDAGRYAVRVYYASGALLSRAATLAVTYPLPVITGLSASQSVPLGGAVTLSVTATGAAPLSYFWRKDGVNIPGATNADLSLAGVGAADAGVYQVVVSNPGGSTVSSNIVLSVIGAPAITGQPTNQVVALGGPVSLTVTATGTEPLLYQWRFNGVEIAGETNAVLALASAQVTNAGLYGVTVANIAGVAQSVEAELRLVGGPVITSQPTGQLVQVGASATLVVVATGDPVLTYQWWRDGVMISGATGASFVIAGAQLTNAGVYSVVVANGLGRAVSSNAVVAVRMPVAITQQPSNQVTTVGGAVRFAVNAVGSPPVTYQWRFNGANLLGETTSALYLRNLQLDQSGGYSVVVADSFNSVTSSIASLLVVPALPSVALFDGTDTAKWVPVGGAGAVSWPIVGVDNALEVAVGVGSIQSTQTFTDFNLHLEFRTPNPSDANGGNSGVFLQGRYEVQIFESFGRVALDTNDCGAIWGQRAPRVNAALGAGEWQTYDITFRAAQFNGTNKVANARVTVVLNGVTVQDDVVITGPTAGGAPEFPLAGPIVLQDNGSQVQFRNIRVTPLDAAPSATWIWRGPSYGSKGIRAVKVDRFGNVFVAASPWFAKHDNSGKEVWRVPLGPSQSLGQIALDPQGNIFLSGSCNTQAFGAALPNPYGTGNAFLAKFNTDGNLLWVIGTDASEANSYNTYSQQVAVDKRGNAYWTGIAAPGVKFGGITLGRGGFVAKIDPAGVVLWAKKSISTGPGGGGGDISIAVDSKGDPVVCGTDYGLVSTLYKISGQNGSTLWNKRWIPPRWNPTNVAPDYIVMDAVAVDKSDNIVFTGHFQGSPVFTPTSATFGTNILETASEATIAAKFDKAGNFLWVRQIDNTLGSCHCGRRGNQVAVDEFNNIYVAPQTQVTPVQTGKTTLPGLGGQDNLIVKYNPAGDLIWAFEVGGNNNDYSEGMTVDRVGNLYLAGAVSNFDPLFRPKVITSPLPNPFSFFAKFGDNPFDSPAPQQGPFISQQPVDMTTGAGVSAEFEVTAGGTEPLSYQWRVNGVDLPGATNSLLIMNGVQLTNAGAYSLRVTNAFGEVVSSNALLTVLEAPVVLSEPEDQLVYVGDDLQLRVTASGVAPLSYLWRFNGVNLPGGTNAALRVAGLSTNEAGEYHVIVSNPAGVTFSRRAAVVVDPAPFVVQPPSDTTVAVGASALLGVRLLGEPPFSYQWRFNGAPLVGETGATLSLVAVGGAQEGRYSVAVANAFGAVVSAEGMLTVIRPAFGFGRATNGSGGLTLTFPAEATGFVLECSPTLGAGAVWTVVTNLATLPSGQLVLPIDPSGGPRYYRLRTP